MTPRSLKVAVPTAALILAAGVGLWTAGTSSAAETPRTGTQLSVPGSPPMPAPPAHDVPSPPPIKECGNCGFPPE